MTLVLTELSNAGIAMAADSAITHIDDQGNIREIDQQGWKKLLRVPSIYAGVSYWGMIGAITNDRFDGWLRRVIQEEENYNDLRSFAEHVKTRLNEAAGNRPLADKQEVGIHVGGFAPWPDGQIRPFFYHVHNGHGEYKLTPILEPGQPERLVQIEAEWVSQPRELFSVNQDFPKANQSLEDNLRVLESRFITRNGHFLLYAIMWPRFSEAIVIMNLIPNISVPRDPNNLNSRKGFLHVMLQIMIRIYECSNQCRVVGGEVSSLGIRQNGFII